MAISWPFDSTVTQDANGNPVYSRTYSANVLARILQKYFRNGVFSDVSTGLQVVAGTGMSVKVNPGDALINGRHFYEESLRTLTVAAAHATLPRIDTVVVRLSLSVSVLAINLYVVTGTAAASPAAPALTRTSSTWELGLANLAIPAASTTVPQSRITDTRLDSSRCGVVASIIGDTNTSAYYAQIQSDLGTLRASQQASFSAWFDALQTALSGDVAGNLYTLILARAKLTQIYNPNLLDNADFLTPVNQRGRASEVYTAAHGARLLDRWVMLRPGGTGAIAWYAHQGLLMGAGTGLYQAIETPAVVRNALIGKTVTVSVQGLTSIFSGSGVWPAVGSAATISISGFGSATIGWLGSNTLVNGITAKCAYISLNNTVLGSNEFVRRVKLEMGDVSTLALDPPVDFAAELAKAQRYYRKGTALFHYSQLTPTVYQADHGYPVRMRAKPVLTFSNPRYFSNGGAAGVTAATHVYNDQTGIRAVTLSGQPATITTPLLVDYEASAELE